MTTEDKLPKEIKDITPSVLDGVRMSISKEFDIPSEDIFFDGWQVRTMAGLVIGTITAEKIGNGSAMAITVEAVSKKDLKAQKKAQRQESKKEASMEQQRDDAMRLVQRATELMSDYEKISIKGNTTVIQMLDHMIEHMQDTKIMLEKANEVLREANKASK